MEQCGVYGVLAAVVLGYSLGVGRPVRWIAAKLNGGPAPDRLGQALELLEALTTRLGPDEIGAAGEEDEGQGAA